MFENLNTEYVKTIKDGIDLSKLPFEKLKNFVGSEIRVDGFYFSNKGNYGEEVIVIGNGRQINMPKRAIKEFKSIMADKNQLNAVLNGHLALTDIKQVNASKGPTTVYTYTER